MTSARTEEPKNLNPQIEISSSGVLRKFGRGSAIVVEPAGLTVSREYEVPWKKQTLDIAKLAHLRFEKGVGSRVIAKVMGIPRTTAITAIRRLEVARGMR